MNKPLHLFAFSVFLCFFASLPLGFSATVQTYDQLITAIREARHASEARVEQAVREEKVRECWEIGKLIDEHVLQHKRADYGKEVLLRLSKDLGMSETELGYMLQFARAYPISRPVGKLGWSHYETLLSINDSEQRDALVQRAEKENWSRRRLQEEVRKINESNVRARHSPAASGQVPVQTNKLTATPGTPGTYRIVRATVGPEVGKVVIDLGFSNYYKTSRDLHSKEGSIVEAIPALPQGGSAPSDKIKSSKRTADDLYTYRAYVVRVLDGDTLEAVIDLGFGVRSVQTLRLRGLDAPEIVSKEGKEAKAYLESVIASSAAGGAQGGAKQSTSPEIASSQKPLLAMTAKPPILIRTSKSDKYDRYLADVFIPLSSQNVPTQMSSPHALSGDPQYLYVNQELLDKGYATRMSE